ncbi:hypothetical protein MUP32_06920, partial [Candidatus Microgenomates bacterium]|nr:hypothetical protein [Candidatus Microgenomates bacterium]
MTTSSVKRKLSVIHGFLKWAAKKGKLSFDKSAWPAAEISPNNEEHEQEEYPVPVPIHEESEQKKVFVGIPLSRYLTWMVGTTIAIAFSIGIYQQFFLKTQKPLAYPI